MILASILIIITGFICFHTGVYGGIRLCKKLLADKQSKVLAPVNYFHNAVYPAPDDPRWQHIKHTKVKMHPIAFKLGNIYLYRYIGEEKCAIVECCIDESNLGWRDTYCKNPANCSGNHDVYKYWEAVYIAVLSRNVEQVSFEETAWNALEAQQHT